MINDFCQMLLSLSISGSIIALILFLIKPLIRNRFNKTWQFYIWMIVVARLLIPYIPPINVIEEISEFAKQHKAAIETPTNIEYNSESLKDTNMNSSIPNESLKATNNEDVLLQINIESPVHTFGEKMYVFWQQLLPYVGSIWLIICMMLLIRKITSYYSFIRFIKKGSKAITEEAVLEQYQNTCQLMSIKKMIPIYSDNVVVSPMCVGFFKHCIILPDKHLDNITHLQYIFRHELTHYKRLDIYYKWLVQFALCIHWFNPIVYFISKEVNKYCELSCDEAIIKKLSIAEQRAYGDTLLYSLELGGNFSNDAVYLTLTENTKLMKERLSAIMKFQKKSKLSICMSAVLTLVCLASCMFTGIKANSKAIADNNSEIELVNTFDYLSIMENRFMLNEIKGTQKIKETISNMGNITVPINIPQIAKKIYVKNYGKYKLNKGSKVITNLDWTGEGHVMFLYTKQKFDTKSIAKLIDKGILPLGSVAKAFSNGHDNIPILSSNFTYVQDNKNFKLNFITTPNNPIYWENEVPESGSYYIYIIGIGDTSITDVKGMITLSNQKTNEASAKNDLSTLGLPGRITKSQLPDNLKSWIEECDRKQDLYLTSKNDTWYVYCNLVKGNYSLDFDNVTEPNRVILNIYDVVDIEKSDGYALLSIPNYDNVRVIYKDRKVEFTNDDSNLSSNHEKKEQTINLSDSLDNDEIILEYYLRDVLTTDSYHQHKNGNKVELTFSNFSGSQIIYAVDYPKSVTVDFNILADVIGEYKVAFISEDNKVITKASSYNGISASKPIKLPQGKSKIVLIGEKASGYCNISFSLNQK